MSLVQKRSLSLFGNLGSHLKKLAPKPHVYFKVTRPVGVKERPVPLAEMPESHYNWNFPQRAYNFYFDGVTRKTRVAKIEKEMAYGGMYDFHVYNKTRGRLFAAPVSYFKRDKSLYFPNFATKSVAGNSREMLDVFRSAKCTVLRVYSSKTGASMTDEYFKVPNSEDNYLSESGYAQFQQSFPNAQLSELLLVDSAMKYYTLSSGSIKRTLPKELWDNYLLAIREKVLERDVREKLLATNVYSGYVYVIDESARIRWVGSGLPTKGEVQGLWKAVKGISKEVIT